MKIEFSEDERTFQQEVFFWVSLFNYIDLIAWDFQKFKFCFIKISFKYKYFKNL